MLEECRIYRLIRFIQRTSVNGCVRSEPYIIRCNTQLMTPLAYLNCPASSMCTRFVHASANKNRVPINCVTARSRVALLTRSFWFQWTPEARRLLTGTSTGEFTLWNGLSFHFETIMTVCRRPSRRDVP